MKNSKFMFCCVNSVAVVFKGWWKYFFVKLINNSTTMWIPLQNTITLHCNKCAFCSDRDFKISKNSSKLTLHACQHKNFSLSHAFCRFNYAHLCLDDFVRWLLSLDALIKKFLSSFLWHLILFSLPLLAAHSYYGKLPKKSFTLLCTAFLHTTRKAPFKWIKKK